MDNLRSLMQCLDDISKMIPEGTYLEMCDNLKQVHDNIPKNDDPPVTDNRGVPFAPVLNFGDSDSESESESGSTMIMAMSPMMAMTSALVILMSKLLK